jgi:hypothetical protein
VPWTVATHDEFDSEFDALEPDVQDELLTMMGLIEQFGSRLGRPHADTLNGSKHKNMKELRFSAAGGVWRAAFAFDPERRGVVLAAGDKSGVKESRFYKGLIAKADKRFDGHIAALAALKEQ